MPHPVFLVKVRPMHRSLYTRFLLIFALLFAQLGGLTHGISHALADRSNSSEQSQSPDQSLPHDKHCDLCVAYAHIGSAIGSSSINFAGSENHETPHISDPGSYISNTFVAFAARAPPYSA